MLDVMLYVLLYLSGGLITLLWGICFYSEDPCEIVYSHVLHRLQRIWTFHYILIILLWPILLIQSGIEWVVEQIKWRWG